jgi:ribosomal protein S18 acetylase RimI-like enzyme
VGSRDVERVTAFEHRFARAQATEVVELPWGFAVLQAEFPLSRYHNRIVVTSAAAPGDVVSAADELLGGAGLGHRYVSVDDDAVGRALVADLEAAGYRHEAIASMIHAGPAPDATPEVREVSFDAVRPAIIQDWELAIPDATPAALDQLADRTELYSRGADLRRLAVYDGGRIAAYADLYVDRVDAITQFENLATHPEFRGRGHGGALVRAGLWRSREAGAELSFLTAGLDDWPYRWYQRLGYIDVTRTHHFTHD